MDDVTKSPVRRRRSSWNPPVTPEWSETTSSFTHLRDSLVKDDKFRATGLQSEMETKPNLSVTLKSPRRRCDDIYPYVVPYVAVKPKVLPKPRRKISSLDSPNTSANSDPKYVNSQSEYVLPLRVDVSQEESKSHYATMSPINKTAASPLKEKQNGLQDRQTDDAFLHKVIDDHLICNICNKRYDQPKMLRCSHSFCTHCLSEKIQHKKTPARTVACPICAEDTPLPGNGVSDLRDNILLRALIDDVSEHEASHVGQRSDDRVFFDESEKSSNENKILRVKTLSVKTYEVMSVKKDRPLEPFLTDHSAGNDEIHPNHSTTHFCKTCKKLICLETQCGHIASHSKHLYCDAALAEQQAKILMEGLLDFIKIQKVEYVKSVSSLEDCYCRLHSMVRNTKKKISDQEKIQIEKIKEQSAALKEEVAQLGNERAKIIEEEHKKHCERAETASHNQDILEHVINKASQLEVLLVKDNVIKKCNKTIKEEIPKPMHKLSFLDFAEAQEGFQITMGHLLQTERWKLEEELVASDVEPFQLSGYVAMYSNGDIAVTDMINWQLTVIGQDDKRCKKIEKSDKALFNPFAIAINKYDELLVIDQNKVKVFDKEMKFLFEVPNSFPQQQNEYLVPSLITCLAVDKQNRIAVGNRGKRAVSLHRRDGQLIRVIRADLIDTHMTMTNGERIVYGNYQERKLVSMDYKGNLVFCVSMKEDKNPTGVCCDAIGFIYVAVHSMFYGKCEIHHYNRTGELIGCMVEGLSNPLGLIFLPRDKLAVADKDSVKIYRRV